MLLRQPLPDGRGSDWSENLFGPAFQHLLDLRHELIGEGAIDQAMVEGEREMADAADGDGVVDHHGSLVDRADAHDGDLRLVDHRRAHQTAEAAEVGDGESPAGHLVGLELGGARAARSTMERCKPSTFFSSAPRITGTIRLFSSATAMPI